MAALVEIDDLGRDYGQGSARLTVLDAVSTVIERGEFVAITGPSGSGKSTLLGLIAGLDQPSRGRVRIDGSEITALNEDRRAAFRGRHIGFVFQSFQLIPTLTALENVRVPAELLGDFKLARTASALLERVGLGGREQHFPAQLSGGEMQRVAIARAIITRPALLLADEPTGNLDSASGARVLELLVEVAREATLVLVTHNAEIAAQAERELVMRDGRIVQTIAHRRVARERRSLAPASSVDEPRVAELGASPQPLTEQ
jgi:putative ABC transport system ATP-binding protein